MGRMKGGEIRELRRFHTQRLTILYAAPWLVWLLTFPVANLAWWRWHTDPLWTAVVGMAGAALTVGSYLTWDRRHHHTRNSVTLLTGILTTWFTLAVASSPFHSTMLSLWLLGGPAACILWNLQHAAKASRNDQDKPVVPPDPLWGRVRGMKGRHPHTEKITEIPGRLEAVVQLPAGEMTAAELRASTELLEQAMGLPRGSLSVSDLEKAGKVLLGITPGGNPLKEPVPHPGPSAPGASIADAPLRIGKRSDARDLAVWVVGSDADARVLPMTLVTGVTGSGKGETVVDMVLEARSRTDCVPVMADPAKFLQTFGDIRDAFEITASDKETARTLVSNLPEAAAYRSLRLGELGYAQWEPECWVRHGIPHVLFCIEEAADFGRNKHIDEVVRKCRSTGIAIVVSMQIAIYDDIARKTRGQFGNSLAHGVRERVDAQMALLPETLSSGADPTRWSNSVPGMLYAELAGVPKQDWVLESRAFRAGRDDKRRMLAAHQESWARLDDATAAILLRGLPSSSVLRTAETERDTGQETVRETADTVPDARTLIRQRIEDLRITGFVMAKRDFTDLEEGRSRTWIYGELDILVREGVLAKAGEGKYTISGGEG